MGFYGYTCLNCELWGDLLLGYGVLNGGEEILGADSEIIQLDKDFILKVYLGGVKFRKKNSELTGIECSLEEVDSFEDLSLSMMDKILSCTSCRDVYQQHYRTGRELALVSR